MITNYAVQVDMSHQTQDNPWQTIAEFTSEEEAQKAIEQVVGAPSEDSRITLITVFETALEYRAFIYQTGIDAGLIPERKKSS